MPAANCMHGAETTLKAAAVTILTCACVAALAACVIYDSRLPSERRQGDDAWKVWWAPWRWLRSDLYTPEGKRYRQLAVRYAALAFVLAVLALAIHDCAP